jgi:hypothetical protein
MSLIGKILAVVNILAALGFVYLAVSDYGKRKQWSYAAFRHDRAIQGLPLNDDEKDVDGREIVKDLSDPGVGEMFQGTTGQPVKTQLKELQDVRGKIQGQIDDGQAMTVPHPLTNAPLALNTPAQKRAWFLLPLARSLTERDVLLNQLIDQQEKVDAAAFNKPFDDVLAKQDPGDKKQAIANLLFALLETTPPEGQQPQDVFETPAYKRYVVVVGRRAAAAAVDSQAAAVAQLARDTETVLAARRSAFAAEHGRIVTRIRDLAEVVARENAALETQKAQTDRQQQLVAERQRQVKNLEDDLAAARKQTSASLAEQAKLEQAVLEEQRKLRDANQKNRDLLKEIEKSENGK